MSKIWKRSLSFFLAMVMVFGMLPMPSYAAEDDGWDSLDEVFEDDGFEYESEEEETFEEFFEEEAWEEEEQDESDEILDEESEWDDIGEEEEEEDVPALSGDTRKVYFCNAENWETVWAAWSFAEEAFTDEAFPGVELTEDEVLENAYVLELPVEADEVCFSDGLELTEELLAAEAEAGLEVIHQIAVALDEELDCYDNGWVSYDALVVAPVQALIDALPGEVNSDEECEAVWTAIEAIDAAMEALTAEQKALLNTAQYDAALDAAAAFFNPEEPTTWEAVEPAAEEDEPEAQAEADGWYWNGTTLYIKDGSITKGQLYSALNEKFGAPVNGTVIKGFYYGNRATNTTSASDTAMAKLENDATVSIWKAKKGGLFGSGDYEDKGSITVKYYYVIDIAITGTDAGSVTYNGVTYGNGDEFQYFPSQNQNIVVNDVEGWNTPDIDQPTASGTLTLVYTEAKASDSTVVSGTIAADVAVTVNNIGIGDGITVAADSDVVVAAQYIGSDKNTYISSLTVMNGTENVGTSFKAGEGVTYVVNAATAPAIVLSNTGIDYNVTITAEEAEAAIKELVTVCGKKVDASAMTVTYYTGNNTSGYKELSYTPSTGWAHKFGAQETESIRIVSGSYTWEGDISVADNRLASSIQVKNGNAQYYTGMDTDVAKVKIFDAIYAGGNPALIAGDVTIQVQEGIASTWHDVTGTIGWGIITASQLGSKVNARIVFNGNSGNKPVTSDSAEVTLVDDRAEFTANESVTIEFAESGMMDALKTAIAANADNVTYKNGSNELNESSELMELARKNPTGFTVKVATPTLGTDTVKSGSKDVAVTVTGIYYDVPVTGGTVNGGKTSVRVNYGETAEVVIDNQPTGYTTKLNVENGTLTNGVLSDVNNDTKLSISSEANKYTVTWKINGEEHDTDEVVYDAAVTAPEYTVPEGYTFSGWTNIPATMPAEDIELNATLTPIDYKVTWVWKNADGDKTTEQMLPYGTAVVVPSEIPAQYTVGNVTYTRTGWTPELKNDATVPVDGITYTATYTEATAWIVTFDTDGGSNINPVTVIVPEGETNVVVKPEVDPTKAGYRFDDWYLKGENDELAEKPYDFATPVTEDITLVAKWVKQYKVTYVSDYGTAPEAKSYDVGTTITIADNLPKVDGFVMDGWYIDDQKVSGEYTGTEDVTINAKWLADGNDNTVPDSEEIFSIKVIGEGKIYLSEDLIEQGISTPDTKSYVFDSKNPTITITATPVLDGDISKTYVKSIGDKGAAELKYESFAATETVEVKLGDVVEVIFEAVPVVKNPADVVEYNFFTREIPYEDIYNSVVSAPQILDEETKVEYLYYARPAMTHTVTLDDLEITGLLKTALSAIGYDKFTFEMPELWLPLNAEIGDQVSLSTAVSDNLNKNTVPELLALYNEAHDAYIEEHGSGILQELAAAAAGGKAIAAKIQAIYETVYNAAYYADVYEFGYNANGAETVDELIKIKYTHDSMYWETQATVILKDSRKVSYISGSDVSVTYRDFTDEEILANFVLTDAEGNPIKGEIYSPEMQDSHTYEDNSFNETAYQLPIKFAGNEEYRPAQKIVNVTVTKAGLSIDLPNLNITHGDEYDLYANVTPANRFGDKQEVIDSLVEIIIGLDVADLEVTKEGEVSGAGAHIQIMLPQDDTLATIFKTLGLDVYGEEGETLKFDELQGYLDKLDGLLGSVDSGNETVDGIISVLESVSGLVDLSNVEITFGGSYPTDVGVYLYGAVSTSGNYETAYDVAYMLIKPAVAEVDIAWNYVDENYIFSKQVLEYFDLGAHIVDPEKYDAETLEKLELLTFFAGVDENGKFVTAWDGAELGNGAYAEIAFLIEFGNELYYAEPLARPVVIIPNVVDAQIQVDGKIADEYLLTFDGEAVDAELIFNTELDLSDKVVEQSIKYYGMKTNGKIYDSEVDPTNAGAYGAVATVIVREQNGDLVAVGADVALVVIEPTTSTVTVEDKIVKNETVKFRDLVTAESVGTDLKPDTTIITAGIDTNEDINEKGWDAVNGVVNIDFPAWMDELLAQYVPSVQDGITAAELKDKLINKLPDVSAELKELGATNEVINALANLTENITKVLDEMPENIKLTFHDDAQANDIGAYIVVAVVTDSDHYPSADAGYLVVLPEVTQVELKWNYEDKNGIFTRDLLELEGVDLLAKAYKDGKAVEANITYQFISIDKNGKLVSYTNPATVPNGAYVEIAYIELFIDGELVVGDLIARPVVIVASNCNVNVENVETVFDNEAHEIIVNVTDLIGNKIEVADGELTVLYAGLQTNGKPYASTQAPVHAGVYEALVTYIKRDENGEIRYYGANAGYVMIDLAESEIAVTGGTVAYDGKGHTVKVENVKGHPYADYTLISGGVSISGDADAVGVDAFHGNVNIDFPRWLEEALKESGEFEFIDGVDAAYLVRFIKSYREDLIKAVTVDKLVEWDIVTEEQQNAYVEKLNAYIDQLIAVLNEMPKDVKLTFEDSITYTEPGAYFYYGVITDSDHYPSTDTGLLVIEKAEVTVTMDSLSKIYGAEDPALTYTVEGLVSGDELTVVASREKGENVGEYTITAEASHPYYNVTIVPGTFTITKAPVTIKVDNQTKVYGDADPEFTATVTGLVGDDTLDIEFSRESGENVGEYIIKASAEDDNYDITVEFGALTITKADVVIKVDNKTKVYGDADPEFTAVTEGMKNGEKLDIQFSRKPGEDVGEYIIKADAKNENYNITVNSGTMTIEAKELTAEDIALVDELTYNGAEQTQKIEIKDGDKVLVEGKDYKVEGNTETNAGTYTMTVTGIGNYAGEIAVEWTVAQKALVVDVQDDATKIYGDGEPAYESTFDGLVEGDKLIVNYNRDEGENVGAYEVRAEVSEESEDYGNYTITYATGTLTITPAELTVNVTKAEKFYGEGDEAIVYEFEVTGYKLSDDEKTVPVTVARDPESKGENAGNTYKLTASVDSKNYTVKIEGANLTIKKAEFYVVANDKTMVLDEEIPALDFTIDETQSKGKLREGDALDIKLKTEPEKNSAEQYVVGEYEIVDDGTVKECENWIIKEVKAGKLTVELGDYVCWDPDAKIYWDDLSEALDDAEIAEGAETIEMLADYTEKYVIIAPGTTLDLADQTVTASYVAGFEGSYLTGDINSGKLYVPTNHFELAEGCYFDSDVGFDVLPIYVNDHYTFSYFRVNISGSKRGLKVEGDKVYFQFAVDASGWAFNELKNGATDNELSVIVRMTWQNASQTGEAHQDFIYLDEHVGKTYSSSQDLYLSLEGFEALDMDMSTLEIKAMMVSDSGAYAACEPQRVQ